MWYSTWVSSFGQGLIDRMSTVTAGTLSLAAVLFSFSILAFSQLRFWAGMMNSLLGSSSFTWHLLLTTGASYQIGRCMSSVLRGQPVLCWPKPRGVRRIWADYLNAD